MSDVIAAAVSKLAARIGNGFDGSAKFEISGEGSIVIDANGVRAGNDATDVTLISDTETFRDMLNGALSPATAYMSGRLKIEGNMGLALKLGSALA